MIWIQSDQVIKFTWQRIKSETVFAGGENPGDGDSGGADEDWGEEETYRAGDHLT